MFIKCKIHKGKARQGKFIYIAQFIRWATQSALHKQTTTKNKNKLQAKNKMNIKLIIQLIKIKLKEKSADKILLVVICSVEQSCFEPGLEHCQSRGLSHLVWKTVPDFSCIKLKRSLTVFSPDPGHQQETCP